MPTVETFVPYPSLLYSFFNLSHVKLLTVLHILASWPFLLQNMHLFSNVIIAAAVARLKFGCGRRLSQSILAVVLSVGFSRLVIRTLWVLSFIWISSLHRSNRYSGLFLCSLIFGTIHKQFHVEVVTKSVVLGLHHSWHLLFLKHQVILHVC